VAHEAGLTRRRALGLLGGAGAAAAVAACSGSSHPAAKPGPTRSRPATGRGDRVKPTAADWQALQRRLTGSLRRPGDTGYDEARLLFDRRFDHSMPAAVAGVASASDIANCLAFARNFDQSVRVRSGGHSYIGASTGPGIVIDLRALSDVSVDSVGDRATIGAGAALVDVYSQLAAHGVSVPAGSCPTVGISGLALGGGVGVVSPCYGLTCDRLIEATVVTAEGTTITCNAGGAHADLYWALRGGGGSFGVVTALTLATHPTPSLAHAYLAWPWSAAADVVTAWQSWAMAGPSALWSSVHVLATGKPGPPTIEVPAVFVGSSAGLDQHIGALVDAVPTAPSSRFVTEASYEETMLLEAGCAQLSVAACHVAAETPGGTLPRDAFVAGSDFFRRPIPSAGVNALVAAVEQRQADSRLGAGGASFDVLGGAVDDLSPHQTAWVHRGALFDAQYTASWASTPGNGPLARNQHSLARIHNSVRRYATGEAYQNYADDTLRNPLTAYYGGNLERLIAIRRHYDPEGMFTQPQCIPLESS
jgi:FAD/FMN-containing dehydrogenase